MAASEAAVLLADSDCPEMSACRAVSTFVSDAQSNGWDLTAGKFFSVVTTEGGLGSRPLSMRPSDCVPVRPLAGGSPVELFQDALLSSRRIPHQILGPDGGRRDHDSRWF